MPKDARLVSTIVGIWDINSFLRIPNAAATMNDINTQALPRSRVSKSKKGARARLPPPPDPARFIKERPPSNGRQTAKKSTGGKPPDVREKLLAKAARR